jgi:hypothetical protein
MFEKYFGCSMPYDGVGEFLQSHHMAKHVGALSKQNFDQLKAYTGAVVEKLSSKNAHSDHNRRHNYPGNQGAQDLYASMYVSYEELQGFRSSWARAGEEIEEKFNPSANTDDPLFTLGSADPLQGVHELQCIHNETSNPCALAASFKELAVIGRLATALPPDSDLMAIAYACSQSDKLIPVMTIFIAMFFIASFGVFTNPFLILARCLQRISPAKASSATDVSCSCCSR